MNAYPQLLPGQFRKPALYLVSSSLANFDRKALGSVEVAIRLAVAVLIMVRPAEVYVPALAAGVLIIGVHMFRSRT